MNKPPKEDINRPENQAKAPITRCGFLGGLDNFSMARDSIQDIARSREACVLDRVTLGKKKREMTAAFGEVYLRLSVAIWEGTPFIATYLSNTDSLTFPSLAFK